MAEKEGYHSVAQFLDLESGIPILRRFGTLSCLNLLYMQAELTQLEQELHCITKEDAGSGDENRKSYRYSHLALQRSLEQGDGLQWEKILEIREKLEKYQEAVLRYHRVKSLPKPSFWETAVVRRLLNTFHHQKYFLRDIDYNSWDVDFSQDLIAVAHHTDKQDLFSQWAQGPWLSWLHRTILYPIVGTTDPETTLSNYSDAMVGSIICLVRSAVATVLPAAAIAVILYVDSFRGQFILLLFLSIIFSAALSIFTRARGIEVFMATAAYASIQAVFLTTTSK